MYPWFFQISPGADSKVPIIPSKILETNLRLVKFGIILGTVRRLQALDLDRCIKEGRFIYNWVQISIWVNSERNIGSAAVSLRGGIR